MRKYLTLVLFCVLVLSGCANVQEEPDEEETWAKIPMVMIDGNLYLDTGYTNNDNADSESFDGEITAEVDGAKEPTEDDQSNFGTGYKYRYSSTEGAVELYLNGEWRIFATEEVRRQMQFPEEDEEHLSEIPGATRFVVDIYDRAEEEQLPCDEAIELFYEDEDAEYYFSCIKSHYIIVMDNTGRTMDVVTALNEGLITIADLDYYGIEYLIVPKCEIVEPYVSLPDFSYLEDMEIYKEGMAGVKTDGFVNMEETPVHSEEDAFEIAKKECTIEWTDTRIFLDAAECVWKVVFFEEVMAGGSQTVYLDYNGITLLIVYGE